MLLLLLLLTDAGHLWTCVENKEKAREWVWRRISVGKRFTQVACSRNHYHRPQRGTGPHLLFLLLLLDVVGGRAVVLMRQMFN